MIKEEEMQGYTEEMEMGKFLSDLYRGINHVRTGVWLLVVLEVAKFVLW